MFLLPGLLITWYVTNTPIPPEYATEIKRYLFARQHQEDGGWGLHIEAHSSVFGTCMNYVALRIVGVSEDDPRMVKARGLLHKFGGAIYGPHWAKAWLSILGVMDWDCVNPVPPEIWYVSPLAFNDLSDGRQASPRLGAICSLEMVDPYSPGVLTLILHLVQEVVSPRQRFHKTAPCGDLHATI